MTSRLFVVRGQRVPVGDEVEAVVLVLQPHPVLQRAVVVAQVHGAGGAHAGENSGSHGGGGLRGSAILWATRRYTASTWRQSHRDPHFRPRLQHGGHRAALRCRGLAGAVAAVVSNRPTRPGCSLRPRTASPPAVVDHKTFATREAFDDALAEAIDALCARPGGAGRLHAHPGRGLRAPLRGPHAQHPPVAAAGLPRAAHAPARLDAGCKAGRGHGAFRDAGAGPRADRDAVGGAVLAGDDADTLAARVLATEHASTRWRCAGSSRAGCGWKAAWCGFADVGAAAHPRRRTAGAKRGATCTVPKNIA
jgi:phosphoribosylglycinamide formyltransferase 1